MLWLILVLLAWAVAAVSCLRLCLAAADAPRHLDEGAEETHDDMRAPYELTLPEAAFLAGGPQRVTELTLVSMHRGRRLLLAHTGWATVVDPDGENDLERAVIGAIGPSGQAPTAAVRAAVSAAASVGSLADRLVRAGLAVPDAARNPVVSALRAVRGSTVLTVVLAVGALLTLPQGQRPGAVMAWFALPLVLTLGCLAIARFEVHAYTGWASPLGNRLLDSLIEQATAATGAGERARLTQVAVHGVHALDDPQLRAAFGCGRAADRIR
ncbi:TIGR04222 domain-containing membrane protein [Streptomyces sp. ISL-10]|uniref:TIGR04222 domain-containing membrane protein n=1 Tax=Streptomyces sp. ISL-10 TaxID=2819172 RepID=UPI001BE964F1|nr:TIGR04222 domain-containing membrane protein [Streptomyces sp. ISL-10]MBT2364105.1 TIGR04222 domain-containing membrane protein [Streptomyces sp. ISL-10]